MNIKRERLEELDLIRGICMIFVVSLHVFGYFMAVDQPGSTMYVRDGALIHILRFSRQTFMFLTGIVLYYNYANKELELGTFYRKRVKGILIPYLIWSTVYIYFTMAFNIQPIHTFGQFLKVVALSVINGTAWYHLYYVVVTLQFYLIFPVFLKIMRLCQTHIKALIIGSFISYLLLVAIEFYGIENNKIDLVKPFSGTFLQSVMSYLVQNIDRIWISYFFYFVLGAIAGMYITKWREWVTCHKSAIRLSAVGILLLLFVEFIWYVLRNHNYAAFGYEVTVLKPSLFLYSVVMIMILYERALALQKYYIKSKKNIFTVCVGKIINTIANHSFAVYLIHPIILYTFESYALPYINFLSHDTQLVLTLIAGIVGATIISILLRAFRYTSLAVGVTYKKTSTIKQRTTVRSSLS